MVKHTTHPQISSFYQRSTKNEASRPANPFFPPPRLPPSPSLALLTYNFVDVKKKGTHYLPQRCRRRIRLCLHRSPAPLPRSRRARKADTAIHQHSWRLRHCRISNLRYHDIHIFPRINHLCRPSGLDGILAPLWRRSQKEILFTA